MTELPRITLITVVRNGAAFIERCLQSVADQHYPNLEYIVLDGASSDGTQSIIERYAATISLYHSRPDKGPYDAAQQAFAMATGELIGYVMADDWLSPNALNEIAALYVSRPHTEIVCFGMQEYRQEADGNLRKTKHYYDPEGEIFTLQDGMYCQGVNRFYSASIMKEEGYFREALYKNLADRDFYLRLGARGIQKVSTSRILYNFLVHPGSNSTGGSAEKVVTFLDETARIAEDYMKKPMLSPIDLKHLADWYCFNVIRSLFFRVKLRRYREALQLAASAFIKRPACFIRNLIYWKMPEPYRAKYDN